jgi:hypothetical protein
LQQQEFSAWTKRNYRARWEYYFHPFISVERAECIQTCLKDCGRDIITFVSAGRHTCKHCLLEEMSRGERGERGARWDGQPGH